MPTSTGFLFVPHFLLFSSRLVHLFRAYFHSGPWKSLFHGPNYLVSHHGAWATNLWAHENWNASCLQQKWHFGTLSLYNAPLSSVFVQGCFAYLLVLKYPCQEFCTSPFATATFRHRRIYSRTNFQMLKILLRVLLRRLKISLDSVTCELITDLSGAVR